MLREQENLLQVREKPGMEWTFFIPLTDHSRDVFSAQDDCLVILL